MKVLEVLELDLFTVGKHHVVAGTLTQVSGRGIRALNCPAISPAPSLIFLRHGLT